MFTFNAICQFAIDFLSLPCFVLVLSASLIYFGFNVFHNFFTRR